MKKINSKLIRKELVKKIPISDLEIESERSNWHSKVIIGSEDLILASKYNSGYEVMTKEINELTFQKFLNDSSAQSMGKFAEFLFTKFCNFKNINFKGEHKGGVDFIIESDIKIDVKAVRHLKTIKRNNFRRHHIEKQLPNVHYAYIIFWKDAVELRVEINDITAKNYDCFFESDLINNAWQEFDKNKIKFLDKKHAENTKILKDQLRKWISENLNIKSRIIQRKINSGLSERGDGGWGADNFYENSTKKHQLVVLLGIKNGEISYIHAYPTNEHMQIPRQLKPVGTNSVEIWCYKPNLLPERYKFEDLNDFKFNVKVRFGF